MRISVVIPAHNSGRSISRTLGTVLAQTRPAEEVIVVDDGSTDNTAEEIRKFGASVRYVFQENAGASAARNTGIRQAQGEWIAFLDADDEWLPEKLQLQVEHLQRNPKLVWTTANFYRCLCAENRRGCDVDPRRAEKLLAGREYFTDFFKALVAHCMGCMDTMVIRKDVLEQVGMFPTDLIHSEDTDCWFRIAYRWPHIGFVSQPLAIYHLNVPESITNTQRHWQIRRDLISRHLQLAADHGRSDSFRPCAAHFIRRSVRGMLFQNQPDEIRTTLDQFGGLLPAHFRWPVRVSQVFPAATAAGLRMVSRVVRTLRLRRRMVRPPRAAAGVKED